MTEYLRSLISTEWCLRDEFKPLVRLYANVTSVVSEAES